jgi:hypothetical protein
MNHMDACSYKEPIYEEFIEGWNSVRKVAGQGFVEASGHPCVSPNPRRIGGSGDFFQIGSWCATVKAHYSLLKCGPPE